MYAKYAALNITVHLILVYTCTCGLNLLESGEVSVIIILDPVEQFLCIVRWVPLSVRSHTEYHQRVLNVSAHFLEVRPIRAILRVKGHSR